MYDGYLEIDGHTFKKFPWISLYHLMTFCFHRLAIEIANQRWAKQIENFKKRKYIKKVE